MYLTQLILNARSRQVRKDLSNPYEMHRTLSRVFSEALTAGQERFLWRLEHAGGYQPPKILVLSVSVGQWDLLDQRGPYLASAAQYKRFDLSRWAVQGAIYRFRLRANPTVAKGGKRRALLEASAALSWLERQGERGGFAVKTAWLTESGLLRCDVERQKKTIMIHQADFDGVLQVSDVERFTESLRQGIGPAKALGCGLLSVAPCLSTSSLCR